jgi:hypothetical protein
MYLWPAGQQERRRRRGLEPVFEPPPPIVCEILCIFKKKGGGKKVSIHVYIGWQERMYWNAHHGRLDCGASASNSSCNPLEFENKGKKASIHICSQLQDFSNKLAWRFRSVIKIVAALVVKKKTIMNNKSNK